MPKSAGESFMSGEMQSLKEKISRLEVRKSALKLELDNLDGELTELHNRQVNLEARMAPIWMLPNELLSYIFELGAFSHDSETKSTSSNDSVEGSNVYDSLDFPTLVSHVSRRFRHIAITTPTLWSEIVVLDLERPRLDHIKTYLKRSGSLPYSIRLLIHEGDYFSALAIKQVMTLVRANIHRLERFGAWFRFFKSIHHVMQYLDEPAPQLATLELFANDCREYFDEEMPFRPQNLRDPPLLFDGQMPKLTRVFLDGVHVAWPQLKNLNFLNLAHHTKDVRPTYGQFRAMLENSPSLRELSLRGSAPLLSDEACRINLSAPLLELLHLSNISLDCATALMSVLHAPNLRSLILSKLNMTDYSDLLDLIAGPPALFPNLTSLKLKAIEASDASAARLLRAYPKLESLELYALPQWVTLLECSTGDGTLTEPAERLVCPALKSLRCVKTDPGVIKGVLNKRKEANVPLPKLEIDLYFFDPWIYIWLRSNTQVETIIDSSDCEMDDDGRGLSDEYYTDEPEDSDFSDE